MAAIHWLVDVQMAAIHWLVDVGPRAFAIAGPQGWNNVAMDLHDSSMSYREFCSKLKTYLYHQLI